MYLFAELVQIYGDSNVTKAGKFKRTYQESFLFTSTGFSLFNKGIKKNYCNVHMRNFQMTESFFFCVRYCQNKDCVKNNGMIGKGAGDS